MPIIGIIVPIIGIIITKQSTHQRPLHVGGNDNFSRYAMMEESQFPDSKNLILSDYQHANEIHKKEPLKNQEETFLAYDQRDSKNVKTMFGHPTAYGIPMDPLSTTFLSGYRCLVQNVL